jgi:hypothetical protein
LVILINLSPKVNREFVLERKELVFSDNNYSEEDKESVMFNYFAKKEKYSSLSLSSVFAIALTAKNSNL